MKYNMHAASRRQPFSRTAKWVAWSGTGEGHPSGFWPHTTELNFNHVKQTTQATRPLTLTSYQDIIGLSRWRSCYLRLAFSASISSFSILLHLPCLLLTVDHNHLHLPVDIENNARWETRHWQMFMEIFVAPCLIFHKILVPPATLWKLFSGPIPVHVCIYGRLMTMSLLFPSAISLDDGASVNRDSKYYSKKPGPI